MCTFKSFFYNHCVAFNSGHPNRSLPAEIYIRFILPLAKIQKWFFFQWFPSLVCLFHSNMLPPVWFVRAKLLLFFVTRHNYAVKLTKASEKVSSLRPRAMKRARSTRKQQVLALQAKCSLAGQVL